MNDAQVLQDLKEGGCLRYFYLGGGVNLCKAGEAADGGTAVNITTFLGLRERGHIATDGENFQYPQKHQAYRITDSGRAYLAKASESA